MEHRLLTLTETAEIVRRPQATLRYWRYKGFGPKSYAVAGRVMYRESEVQAWLEAEMQSDEERR